MFLPIQFLLNDFVGSTITRFTNMIPQNVQLVKQRIHFTYYLCYILKFTHAIFWKVDM